MNLTTHPEKSQNTAVTVHNTRFNTNSFVFYPAVFCMILAMNNLIGLFCNVETVCLL